MDLNTFDRLNFELKDITNELAYHIVGDPLVLTNLSEYLNISKKHNLKVQFKWGYRTDNTLADELVNETLDKVAK